MERLTERMANGTVRRTDVMGESAMLRLAAYEDIGLTPEEVADVAAREENVQEALDRMEDAIGEYRQKIADGRLVEVVRCDGCRYWHKEAHFGDACACAWWSGGKERVRYTKPDDYCSKGERREKE